MAVPSILLEIQDTVEVYAGIMSKVAQIEVEVVDENLFRIAGTGLYASCVNEDMSAEGYVYQHVLHTGNMEIIYEPGEESLCRECPKRNSCREEIEISMPIRLGGKSIGVIGLIGSSPQIRLLQDEIRKVAGSMSTVLITGESGTGKEVVASAIWKASDRREGRFVAINCGAIPEPLLESELFGYVKGAFTGADPNGRMGKFELANKGVIFLDEIGDMPLYLQVKLLRVLQERKIIRIGSNQVIPIDVRILAATNKNLKEMIEKKQFREDLYYRLNVIPLKIPPLRERKEDIRDLSFYFADRYAGLLGKRLVSITEDVMDCMCRYPWYGNVRELENTVEFMVNMMEEDGILDRRTLPDHLMGAPETNILRQESAPVAERISTLKSLEEQEIQKALKLFRDDTEGKKKAAKALGISLATLYRKLE